jgi:hypothetical protein
MNNINSRYWRIAPGQGGFLWSEQRDNNCIAVGWNDTGNLNNFKTKERFEKRFLSIYKQNKKKAANELWRFYSEVKKGDKILANSGKQVFGIGTVVEGGYKFNSNLCYSHSHPVRWDIKFWSPINAEDLRLPKRLLGRICAILTISELEFNDWKIISKKVHNLNNPFKTISEFEGLSHAPRTEQETIVLFSKISRFLLQMKIESVGTRFPDALIKVRKGNIWQIKSAEFELYSSSFKSHMHDYRKDPGTCDMIICWKDDWKDKPKNLKVIELEKELRKII